MMKVHILKGRKAGHVDVSLHLPHVIINSIQVLRALSHLQITFQKAPFSVLIEDE